MQICKSEIRGKENILSDLPSPQPVLGGGNDTNDVIMMSMKELLRRYDDTEVATQPEQLLGCLQLENT